jgi:hypothetical protein
MGEVLTNELMRFSIGENDVKYVFFYYSLVKTMIFHKLEPLAHFPLP